MKNIESSQKKLNIIETKNETAYLLQVGSYTKNLKNILNVEKFKNINKVIKLQKKNIKYSIFPDIKNKDTVNVLIQHLDPEDEKKILKNSVYSFVNGRLEVRRDIHGNLKSQELIDFFRAFNIQLQEIDLIIKKEYEFYQIKQRLPGIFCSDWRKPFNKILHVRGDSLEIKNTPDKLELTFLRNGEEIKWTMDRDFLLLSGDLTKILYVLNRYGSKLVDFDHEIGSEITREKDEHHAQLNNLHTLFVPLDMKSRTRNFVKEYTKTNNNKLLITGDGENIIFINKHSGPEKKWIFNADKKMLPGSSDIRELYLILQAFHKECEDLKIYLKNQEEEKNKTDHVVISFMEKHPKIFMKRNDNIVFRKKEAQIKISSADAFNAEGGKFFLTYEKGGDIKHFYFSEKSLQLQTNDAPPLGADRESSLTGEAKKTYYFNTDAGELLAILKTFESQF